MINSKSPSLTADDDLTSRPRLRGSRLLERLPEVLAFRAEYLEHKLLALGVVATAAEAAALFQEVKKYLVLSQLSEAPVPMISARVDEVWHQFVLFTRQYHEFCQEFAGHYLHHEPRESPVGVLTGGGPRPLRIVEFAELYARWFGPLPSFWYDERSLQADSILYWAEWGQPLRTQIAGDRVELVRGAEPASVLCRASLCAQAALEFLAAHRVLLVREIPGLSASARLVLCRPLVEAGVLKIKA